MNLRNAEILKWCKKYRPDIIQYLTPQGNPTADAAFALLLSVGFEAGRQFQANNPKTELNNPNVYLK